MKYEFKVELRKTNHRKRKSDQSSKTGVGIGRLKKNLVLAHQIDRYMDENNISTIGEMSKLTNTSVARLSQLLDLTLLYTRVQEKILVDSGKQHVHLVIKIKHKS